MNTTRLIEIVFSMLFDKIARLIGKTEIVNKELTVVHLAQIRTNLMQYCIRANLYQHIYPQPTQGAYRCADRR